MGYSPWGRKRVGHNLATKQQHSLNPDFPWVNSQSNLFLYESIAVRWIFTCAYVNTSKVLSIHHECSVSSYVCI